MSCGKIGIIVVKCLNQKCVEQKKCTCGTAKGPFMPCPETHKKFTKALFDAVKGGPVGE